LLDQPVQHRRNAESPRPPGRPASGSRPAGPAGADSGPPATPPGCAPSARDSTAAGPRRYPVDARRPAVPLDARVCGHEVLAAQYLLHEPRSLGPSVLSACRARLTPASRSCGGSAAVPPGAFGPLSPLVCVSFTPRTHRAGSAPRVRPFAGVRPATLASADSWAPVGAPHSPPSLSAGAQVSQGKTRDCRPIYPPHLRRSGPGAIGLRVSLPPRPPIDASYAVRVPRARALPPASFPPHLAVTRLPFR